jgi:hypothetical protein
MGLLLLLLCAIGYYVIDGSRTRHMQVTVSMSWECTTHFPLFPEQAVVLHFVDSPSEGNLYADRTGNFCNLVSSPGKPTVQVTSDVWGSKFGGDENNQEILLNGRPFPLPKSPADYAATIGSPTPYIHAFNRAIRYE